MLVFYFFNILILWVHRGIKGQKTVQNDKKICLLLSLSQEPYIIWLSFMVQMCQMMIFPGVFFNFKILIFRVVRELKGQKMAQNDKNFCLSHLIFQELYIIWSSFMVHSVSHSVSPGLYIMWLWFLVYMCIMIISPGNFFIFQNFDFGDF